MRFVKWLPNRLCLKNRRLTIEASCSATRNRYWPLVTIIGPSTCLQLGGNAEAGPLPRPAGCNTEWSARSMVNTNLVGFVLPNLTVGTSSSVGFVLPKSQMAAYCCRHLNSRRPDSRTRTALITLSWLSLLLHDSIKSAYRELAS